MNALVRGYDTVLGTHRLSLDLIAARRTSPPVVHQRVGTGPIMLAVENYATYDSLVAILPADGEVGEVVYGAGNTLGVVLTALADMVGTTALTYFGDLDVRGLEIAAGGARLAAALGLPPLVPAERLYRLLVEHGHEAKADTKPNPANARAAVTWLPAGRRPASSTS